MSSVQERGLLKSTLLANSDRNKFEDLKNRLQEAVSRLNLAATLEMCQLQTTKFAQMDRMKAKVEEFGGPDAVIRNPDALEEIQNSMDAADQLLLASVSDTRAQNGGKRCWQDALADSPDCSGAEAAQAYG